MSVLKERINNNKLAFYGQSDDLHFVDMLTWSQGMFVC